ncbi:hypothetical protein G7Y89_g10395 [Cudoniella acicularis]|uniref:Uncharacterized protein n=1 Tax=Cudoniella acicularis TaxID=354080 RepID=A0A8H4RDY2_9HELO|nr:hypothetical protein G7Y89_g10395 [Cudoniella acicularis]
MFDFDNDLVDSGVYRRTLMALSNQQSNDRKKSNYAGTIMKAEKFNRAQFQPAPSMSLMELPNPQLETPDDERVSWVSLLSSLQEAERSSRNWDEAKRWDGDEMFSMRYLGTINELQSPKYEISVMLQNKTRSWDYMPRSVVKPYPTTTICHLVEMAAMLGMYWELFDENLWRLRADPWPGIDYIESINVVQFACHLARLLKTQWESLISGLP